MLRRLRTKAGLTQERLAERSAISANGVAAPEAGRRKTPRLTTAGLLCDALQLTAGERAALIAAARNADEEPSAQPGSISTDHFDGSLTEPLRTAERSFVGRIEARRTLGR